MSRQSKTISPTAHYTGHVWARNSLSHPAFTTRRGRLFFAAMQPAMRVSAALHGPTLEGMLVARHRLIDHRLEQAIEEGRVSQVLEIAAGLSPRGWRFARRFGDRLTYIETDLPDMVATKRRILEKTGSISRTHRVQPMDALAEDGPHSLDAVATDLDATQGVAVITEGLLSYLDQPAVTDLWQRIASNLQQFPTAVYLSDLHLGAETQTPGREAFMTFLSAFVRGRVFTHYADAGEAALALNTAGFNRADIHRPRDWIRQIGDVSPGASLVRVIEASPR